ncbi:hypothetical protein FNF28_05446 [Cafeteria roenbergensis]|uniref:Cryptochrome/DNA photolyase FAD-binding domain-containing protein n=1 Tax=Cafeteria roenbergensis TaxID=33653 RepID=A0A5A8D8A3_CAFRO|nr:hypothetical protein FNF28_05446 [Cafeteria roenbergensis]
MAGQGFSSKLSPWLAVGALSPRQVAAEVARYERERVANESTYWLLFELLWRDYFRFACIGWGSDSGFMSNRGRQNVASFLARDLEADWRVGAEWFESLLADHDPCSNYGNWTYVAGVGADPREDRYFSIPKQARNYDGHGTFMRLWLPEGLDVVRRRAKLAFQENAHLTDEVAIKRAVAKGRYWVREIHATHALHKYRSIKKRYY